jgi:hypothetical protein
MLAGIGAARAGSSRARMRRLRRGARAGGSRARSLNRAFRLRRSSPLSRSRDDRLPLRRRPSRTHPRPARAARGQALATRRDGACQGRCAGPPSRFSSDGNPIRYARRSRRRRSEISSR